MNNYNKLNFLSALLILILPHATASTTSPATAALEHRWGDDLWKIRYVLFVDSQAGAAESLTLAKDSNALDGTRGNDYVYLDAQELLPSPKIFLVPKKSPLALNVLAFDTKGYVLDGIPPPAHFRAKITEIQRVVLTNSEAPDKKSYNVANWSQGIHGDISFSPAVCSTLDDFRYGPRWRRGRPRGDFGCREWTAQLYDWQQPYIDVTTYTRRGNFIGEFVGWSRFEDPPKPIIGMHGKQWLCLYDCPAGEQAGVISDIRAWMNKHQFPMPVRPKRQPEYPDSHFQDDINAIAD